METMKLTKSELCKRTGISRPTLDSLLEGCDVKMRTIEAIAQALNVSVGFLFDEEQYNSITNNDKANYRKRDSSSTHTTEDLSTLMEKIELLEKLLAEKDNVISEKERLIADKERLIGILLNQSSGLIVTSPTKPQ
jgi:transcriptional regulator with XRE-family HTH domain